MASHICKELDVLFKKIEQAGFKLERGNNKLKIYPPDKSLPIYICHEGERALHPVRRYLKNVCKINL